MFSDSDESGDDDEAMPSPFARTELGEEERLSKAKMIFEREFNREMDRLDALLKQNQSRITIVKRYLNIIRCCLLQTTSEEGQAVKSGQYFSSIKARLRRREKSKRSNDSISVLESKPSTSTDIRMPNQKIDRPVKGRKQKLPQIPLMEQVDTEANRRVRGQRFKILQRFVIGNVSQWAPERRAESKGPYRWMLYVRGPRESPDISMHVTKVTFYLDPTFRPNDVIDITAPPFHLERRGWGEFLVRIVIVFYLSRNKPLTVYHRLQFDRTQCGYQRGAPETIVDYWIYKDIPWSLVQIKTAVSAESEEKNYTIKEDKTVSTRKTASCIETSDHYTSLKNQESSVNKHKHSLLTGTQTDYIQIEHSYASLFNTISLKQTKQRLIVPRDNRFRVLVKGISGVSLLKSSVEKNNASVLKFSTKKRASVVQSSTKRNGSVLKLSAENNASRLGKNTCQTLLKSEMAEQEKLFRLAADKSHTLPIHQAIPFLLRRLPLITSKATSESYLHVHPYVAMSHSHYRSWNLQRQNAAQYYRAKMIKNILVARESFDESWTCKRIIKYARRYGYVPFPKIILYQVGGKCSYVKEVANDNALIKYKNEQENNILAVPEYSKKGLTDKINIVRSGSTNITQTNSKRRSQYGSLCTMLQMQKNKQRNQLIVMKNKVVKKYVKNMYKNENKNYILRTNTKDNKKKALNKNISKNKKNESAKLSKKEVILNKIEEIINKQTLTEPKRIVKFIQDNDESDENIDFTNSNDDDTISVCSIEECDYVDDDILDVDEERAELCQFVQKASRWESLWRTRRREYFTVPEVTLAIVAELFMEDLLRRSLSFAWNKYDPKGITPMTIYDEDTVMALKSRKEFDILSNSGFGVRSQNRPNI